VPRYFISTANGHEVRDEEGVELSGREALRTLLQKTLTAILHDESANGGTTECSARACDEDGRLVMQARVSIDIAEQ